MSEGSKFLVFVAVSVALVLAFIYFAAKIGPDLVAREQERRQAYIDRAVETGETQYYSKYRRYNAATKTRRTKGCHVALPNGEMGIIKDVPKCNELRNSQIK